MAKHNKEQTYRSHQTLSSLTPRLATSYCSKCPISSHKTSMRHADRKCGLHTGKPGVHRNRPGSAQLLDFLDKGFDATTRMFREPTGTTAQERACESDAAPGEDTADENKQKRTGLFQRKRVTGGPTALSLAGGGAGPCRAATRAGLRDRRKAEGQTGLRNILGPTAAKDETGRDSPRVTVKPSKFHIKKLNNFQVGHALPTRVPPGTLNVRRLGSSRKPTRARQ